MPTFGNSDIIQDQSGNALANVKVSVYGSEADAKAQTNLLATVTTNSKGQWPVTLNGLDMVWVRDPAGNIWSVASDTVAGDHATRLSALESATSPTTFDATQAGNINTAGSQTDGALRSTYVSLGTRNHDAPAFRLFFPEAHGASGNGAGDDSTGLNGAIAAADAAGGGMVQCLGSYQFASSVLLSTKNTIHLMGTTRARSRGTVFTWAGSDTGSCIKFDNASGVHIEGISFNVPATFTGAIIDGRGSSGTPQAFDVKIDWCFFTSAGSMVYGTDGTGGNHTDIVCGTGHNYEIRNNDFYRSNIAIKGVNSSASPAEAVQSVLIERNYFEPLRRTGHIVNPGSGWVINCHAVEPLFNGNLGFVVLQGEVMSGVSITNNWCGDVSSTATGAHIQVAGVGINISGNILLVGSATSYAIQAVGNTTGMCITANRIDGYSSGFFINWGTYTHTAPTVLGNSVPSLILSTGTVPTGLVTNDVGSTNGMLLGNTAFRNNSILKFYNAAGSSTHNVYAATTDEFRLDAIADKNVTVRLQGTGASSTLGALSLQYWNGTAFVNALQVNNTGLILNAPRWAIVRSTLAANGAVTVDASAGDAQITLQANATSTTITNPVDVRKLTITFRQDATGGRTYVWPANCLFAGGTAPSDTTANKQTSVTFRWDGFVSKWYEESRAVAVG